MPLAITRWTARIASIASTALLALFAFGPLERAWPTTSEWLLLAFFPIGVVAGMIIAWKREITGGVVTLASLTAFYAITVISSGTFPGPWFIVFALPGLALLLCGLIERRNGPRWQSA